MKLPLVVWQQHFKHFLLLLHPWLNSAVNSFIRQPNYKIIIYGFANSLFNTFHLKSIDTLFLKWHSSQVYKIKHINWKLLKTVWHLKNNATRNIFFYMHVYVKINRHFKKNPADLLTGWGMASCFRRETFSPRKRSTSFSRSTTLLLISTVCWFTFTDIPLVTFLSGDLHK